jgi:NlpC/P60 family protein
MRQSGRLLLLALYTATGCILGAQEQTSSARKAASVEARPVPASTKHARTLSADDGLTILAAALDSRPRLRSRNDCSHLAHAIYQRAGFPYAYADSSDLYAGVGGFERVAQPQPGDLIVWRGHVGIVIKPSQHVFYSRLRSGPGVDDWESAYWKTRGHARFYRYITGPAVRDLELSSHRPRQLLQVSR